MNQLVYTMQLLSIKDRIDDIQLQKFLSPYDIVRKLHQHRTKLIYHWKFKNIRLGYCQYYDLFTQCYLGHSPRSPHHPLHHLDRYL